MSRKDHVEATHYIPTEHGREAYSIPDLDAYDDAESLCREAMANGGLHTFLAQTCARRAAALTGEALLKVLSLVMHARRPKLAAWQLAFAAGLDLTENKTGPECAAMFGITKQAWFSGVKKIRKELGINYLTPHTRDEKSKEHMRDAYAKR